MNTVLVNKFGNRIRIRCSALIVKKHEILLLKHSGLNKENEFWLPPGGGVTQNESIIECLTREVLEETNLQIENPQFLFLNEFLEKPFHAIELFFKVGIKNEANLALGLDPELTINNQILKKSDWISLEAVENTFKHKVHPSIIKNKALIFSNFKSE